ncbi:MAG: hypothetical protein WDO56_07570 [Gammaproteobacteria bacterium]
MRARTRGWLLLAAFGGALSAPIQGTAANDGTPASPPAIRGAQAAPPEGARNDAAPSVTSPAIFQYIQLHKDSVTGRMEPAAMTLPDEPVARRFSRLRWVPGALEGLGTRHMQWDGSAKASQAIVLLQQIAVGNPSAEAVLYDLLRADDVVTFYNDALDFAAARIPDPEPRLHDLARRLATTSRDRGPVKFGIAMLGSMGDESDLDIVRTLAIHDEFGLYAAEAIAELAPQRQQALFDMAQHVSGWGRIEAVTLMTATPDAKLRRWLLTEGFRNDVTPQYLAYHCATIGDLADAMADRANAGDLAFLAGVSDLIQSLIKPGPSRDSQMYPEIPEVAASYLQDVQGKKDSLSFLLTALALNEYAASAPWTQDQRTIVRTLAAPIIDDKGWRKRVIAALTDDRADLEQAEQAARKLDIETFDLHLKRLEKNGSVVARWNIAFIAAEPRQLTSLVNVAERTFGARFAKGAIGRANTSDAALEAVLQGVARSPGVGIPIVDASLLDISPTVRRAAVETLVRWGGPYLRDMTVRAALSAAADEETDEALKARMVALLNVVDLP